MQKSPRPLNVPHFKPHSTHGCVCLCRKCCEAAKKRIGGRYICASAQSGLACQCGGQGGAQGPDPATMGRSATRLAEFKYAKNKLHEEEKGN